MCDIKAADIKQYVLDNLNIDDDIMAQADRYNTDKDHGDRSKRTVKGIYQNCILTVDELGRHESYTYYDAYRILREGGKIDVQEDWSVSDTAATTSETKETTGDTEFPGNRQITEKGEEK